jgi:hypothetical protein
MGVRQRQPVPGHLHQAAVTPLLHLVRPRRVQHLAVWRQLHPQRVPAAPWARRRRQRRPGSDGQLGAQREGESAGGAKRQRWRGARGRLAPRSTRDLEQRPPAEQLVHTLRAQHLLRRPRRLGPAGRQAAHPQLAVQPAKLRAARAWQPAAHSDRAEVCGRRDGEHPHAAEPGALVDCRGAPECSQAYRLTSSRQSLARWRPGTFDGHFSGLVYFAFQ